MPNNDKLQSFRLYRGRAPLTIQIVGGLMWLAGLRTIIQGLPLILFFGIGILLVVAGVLMIVFAQGLFKLHYSAYIGALVVNALMGLFVLYTWWLNDQYSGLDGAALTSLLYLLVISAALVSQRHRFPRAENQTSQA